MPGFSIAARVEAWADDVIATETAVTGDEYGRHVQMAALQTPQGNAIVWLILVTTRSPLLRGDDLGSLVKVAGNIPPEAAVRGEVRNAIGKLREEFEAVKRPQKASNGHRIPPGLKGLHL